MSLLRMYASAAEVPEGPVGKEGKTWELLWLYVPDYTRNGRMGEIEHIVWSEDEDMDGSYEREGEYFWEQNEGCAGFEVKDECIYRYEEMTLITYAPEVCKTDLTGCEQLIAYARVAIKAETQETAAYQIATTLFTCFVLTVAFIMFSRDTEITVIIPIKKVVSIIQKLAESPLKKPELPKEDPNQM